MLRFGEQWKGLFRGLYLGRLLLAVSFACALFAQENGAPVIIDGQEVARIYGSVGPFTPNDRAPEIERRITALAKKGFSGTIEVRPIPSEKATAIMAGSIILMAVTQVDADAGGLSQDELARKYAASIKTAMEGYRERHSWLSFLIAVAKSLTAWALFLISAYVLWRAIGWLGARVELRFRLREGQPGETRFKRMLLERGRRFAITVLKLVVGLTLLAEASFVLSYTFGLFPETAGISTTLLDYLGQTFGGVGVAIVDYLPNGGFVVLTVVITHYVLRGLKILEQAIESGDLTIKGMHPEMAEPTYQLTRMMVLLFAIIVAFPYLPGGKSEAFKGVTIFVGLLLSLGSSSAVGNVLAGLVLTYMRPYHAGDRVKIADTIGDVLEKSLLVTRLHTIKNVEVVIPNSAILNNQILNYSALARSRGLILNTTVTIGYDAPWRTVCDLLVNAGLGTDGILADPAPFVLQTSLNDFHISYELNAYTDRANDTQNIYSRLHEAIQDHFNRAGIEIMSPTFYALRDGNTVTIPADNRPAGYEAPAFRVRDVGGRGVDPEASRAVGGS
jgi:small-conductance mechanosensitive channel